MGVKGESTFALKDHLFNAETVGVLATALAEAWQPFRRRAFEKSVLKRFPELELKQRIDWIVTVLEEHLPEDFATAVEILEAALPPPLDPTLGDDDFGEFIWGVPAEYVARRGCNADDLNRSLDFLYQATQRFTAENAIRPFLASFPDETLRRIELWTKDDNYHVRRLTSEGIRPYLPWAQQVKIPANTVVAVLERLQADRTRYVTRSVANTLNDLSRDEPELVLQTLANWRRLGLQRPEELSWMTRHATRTLAKQDHPGALELLGYPQAPRYALHEVRAPESVAVGEDWVFAAVLHSRMDQRLLINLKVGFLKANGKQSVKVFKVADAELARGEQLTLGKRVTFRPLTTRTLYPGVHSAELVVNGSGRWRQNFELVES